MPCILSKVFKIHLTRKYLKYYFKYFFVREFCKILRPTLKGEGRQSRKGGRENRGKRKEVGGEWTILYRKFLNPPLDRKMQY